MERRSLTQPLRVEERDGEPTRIEGFASRFYDGSPGTEYTLWKGAVERIMPGAFDELRGNVMALFNHDPSKILGSTRAGSLRLESRAEGLHYSVAPSDTPTSQEVIANVRSGNITGSSFGFRVTDEEWRTEGDTDIREVRKVELSDVSPVTFPAYSGTSAGIRSQEGADEARTSYQSWMDKRQQEADKAFTSDAVNRARAVLADLA